MRAQTESGKTRTPRPPGGLAIKNALRSVLLSDAPKSPDSGGDARFERTLIEIDVPPEKLVSPLLSFLCATDELVRWRAVSAVGLTVSRIARESVESARNIMRRLIWSLNDESGGIGWGAPEAMGEIMARDAQLAREFYCILISYIDERGNPLENDILEQGVLWGIGRLAETRPELAGCAAEVLAAQLDSPDPVKRGLAVRALGFALPDPGPARESVESRLAALLDDASELRIYEGGEMKTRRIGEMASDILARARRRNAGP